MRLIPEIFLGAFLAIAIFAMGMLFASSWFFQPCIRGEIAGVQSLWVPTDSVGLYTLVLAAFTGLLFIVSALQGYFLLRADKTARIAANAANLSARATIGVESPKLFVYALNLRQHQGQTRSVGITIKNYGRMVN
jgi:hypothetical protein